VSVVIDSGPERVRIRVEDDGPGIPEAEREAIRTRAETDLDHASGLGLWLVEWTASLSPGRVSFEENEPRGSVVTLSFPAAEG
jgi:signal transduction histidine kinase